MKRVIDFILCLVLVLTGAVLPSAAAIGTVVGHTLHTDIVAQINGHALRSYNVNGNTAVVAEDLKGYGFGVYWDGQNRLLEVKRAADKTGGPVKPQQWAQYTPAGAQGVIGTRARDIYETDIVTTVAGQLVQSFNVGGETLIWFDDLAPFGTVRWDRDARIISLELGDPLQIAVDKLTRDLEQWKLSAPSSYYERYDHNVSGQESGAHGVLFYAVYAGTTHGMTRNLTWVDPVGTQTNIGMLVAAECPDAAGSLIPREIQLEGEMLTFFTPVADWGDCLCRVNLRTGKLVTLQPLDKPLESWVVNTNGWQAGFATELNVEVKCDRGQAQMPERALPGSGLGVTVSANGVILYHQASMLFGGEEQYTQSDYAKAYDALQAMNLPRLTQDTENTPEQRRQAAEYFVVTLNGTPVSGNLWWSQGNNHVDLNFAFDQPVQLKQGDVLQVRMGLLK